MSNLKFSDTKLGVSLSKKKKSKLLCLAASPTLSKDDLLERAKRRNLVKIPTVDNVIRESRKWVAENTMLIPLPLAVAGDWHIPHTNREWLELLLEVADIRKIQNLIINGDFFDQDQFKIWMDSGVRVDWDTELQAGKEVLEILMKQFNRIYLILGNHDIRIWRQLGSRFRVDHLFSQMIPLDLIGKKVFPAEIRYAKTEDEKWIICHPTNYSKQATKAPLDIVAVEHTNVIGGHGHHLGMAKDQSGKYWGVDCGGMFNHDSMTYNGSTIKSSHAKWSNGFCVINEKSELRLYGDDLEFS